MGNVLLYLNNFFKINNSRFFYYGNLDSVRLVTSGWLSLIVTNSQSKRPYFYARSIFLRREPR